MSLETIQDVLKALPTESLRHLDLRKSTKSDILDKDITDAVHACQNLNILAIDRGNISRRRKKSYLIGLFRNSKSQKR